MQKKMFRRFGKYVLSAIVFVMMIAQSICFSSEVKADSNVDLEINGYQINTNLGAFRTVYSVIDTEDKVTEVGLIYGLKDKITEADLVVGSTNKMVYSFAATSAGKSELCYSKAENAQTYVLTMKFVENVEFFKDVISVKPYAKLKDGTYVYGETKSKSVYEIADTLYQKQLMGNAEKHDYLYDSILSFVNPSYEKKTFEGSGTLVKPGTVEESTSVKQTEPDTTPKPTEPATKYEEATAHVVDGSLPKPEGLTYAGNEALPFYFAWAPVDGSDSYDVYVNRKYVTSVIGGSVNLDASVFTNGAGEYTIGVAAVFGDKVSEATVITYTYTGELVTTEKPTEPPTTPEPTTPSQSSGDYTTDSSIAQPFGLVVTSPANGKIEVVWGAGDINLYNVYIDGKLVSKEVAAASYTYEGYAAGTHTVAIATVVGNKESERITGTVTVGNGGSQVEPTQPPVTQAPDDGSFPLDTSIAKPFGMVLSNPDTGILHVVWGQGNPNCYNVYIDGVRKKTKVTAAGYQFAVQEGTHTVSVATVNPDTNRESERESMQIHVVGSAEETTDYPENLKPQIDTSIPKEDGKMILQLNNKTNGKYRDDQIYWIVVGRNPQTHQLAYLDLDGNLVNVSAGTNDTLVGKGQPADRVYAKKIVHTLAERHYIHLPAIESGRMYLSYGEPVYITFNSDEAGNTGFAGPDTNNPSDANANTLFEYIEFTTEAINGGITFHGNTTRVDFFSFPYMTRLTDQYGGFDRCVGDIGTRDEIFNTFRNSVSAPFKGLADDIRINAPAKTLFREGAQYANYFDDYINRFWNKYSNEDLVFSCEGGEFRGRVQGDRMRFSKTGSNLDFWVDKPSTQDVLEGRGAFNRPSSGDPNRTVTELVIQAQLCAAFTRGIAMQPENWGKPSTYYKSGEICNEYARFFHEHSVSGKAYGFCYDDVNDQSTLVECGNAANWTIDLGW